MKKRSIIAILFVASIVFNLSATNLIVIKGEKANAKIPNATVIRYNDRSPLPNYVEFIKGKEIPTMRFTAWMNQLYKGKSPQFELIKTIKGQLGHFHYRYQEKINGIPVQYGIITTHLQNGEIHSISGEMYPKNVNSFSASISKTAAFQKALAKIGATTYMWEILGNEEFIKREQHDPSASFKPKGKLVYVYPNNQPKGKLHLAYRFNIYAATPLSRTMVWVDANTGDILLTQNLLHHANTPATANTVYSGSRSITTDSHNGSYRLYETGAGGGCKIHTWDMKNLGSMNFPPNYNDAVEITNNSTTWQSIGRRKGALDAHWGGEQVVEFYWNEFGRNSLDGNGMTVNGYAHYGNNIGNAFWDGYRMNYGDGFEALAIIGHEMTHGVVQHTANFNNGEAGALNESFSDIFGKTIEHNSRPNNFNWTVGHDLGMSIRNMKNPKGSNRPDTYQGQYWDAGGEVHVNACPNDYAYYLMVEGGSGTNDNNDSYNVTGIGFDDAIHIMYKALSTYLTSSSNYSDARFYAIKAAKYLFGACSQQVITVTNAYYAIGVGAQYSGGAVQSDFSTTSAQSWCEVPYTVTFQNNSTAGSSATYSWDFGDGGTSSSPNPTHTYTSFGDYDVKLTVTPASAGCGSDSETKTSFIKIDPGNDCSNCDTINFQPPGTASLYPDGSGGYLTGTNTYGDNGFANIFTNYSPYTHVTGAIVYFYGAHDAGNNAKVSINVWDNTGNSGSPGNRLYSDTVPLSQIASILSPNQGQGNLIFGFKTPVPVSSDFYLGVRFLNFGNNDSLAVITNAKGDSPSNMLWIHTSDGLWGSYPDIWGGSSLDLYISPLMTATPPKAIISANKTTICSGESIKFNSKNSLNSSSYEWHLSGGSTTSSTSDSISVTFNNPGTYTVILDAKGGCSGRDADTLQITVNNSTAPTINVTSVDPPASCGDNGTIHISTSVPNGSYTVNYDNGSFSNVVVNNGKASITAPVGTYNNLTISTGACSSGSGANATISDSNGPTITLNATKDTICQGQSTTINASGGTSYDWNHGLGSGATKTVSPSATTTYTVAGKKNGCTTNKSITIYVNSSTPSLSIVANKTTICEGETVNLSVTGATSYTWTPGASLNQATGSNVIASPVTNTTYTVTGSSSCGTATETVNITVNPAPSLPTITQNGDTLSINLPAGETAKWFHNSGVVGTGDRITITESGKYKVVVTNSNGCIASASGIYKSTAGITTNKMNSIVAYPNPTNGTVNIQWQGIDAARRINVYDMIGKQILSLSLQKGEQSKTIDLSRFEKGIYIIKLFSKTRVFSKKITKK